MRTFLKENKVELCALMTIKKFVDVKKDNISVQILGGQEGKLSIFLNDGIERLIDVSITCEDEVFTVTKNDDKYCLCLDADDNITIEDWKDPSMSELTWQDLLSEAITFLIENVDVAAETEAQVVDNSSAKDLKDAKLDSIKNVLKG